MHYDPFTPVENIINKVEDLLEYIDMANCPYSHPQAISKAYIIINTTGKFCESINSWYCFPPIQKLCIAFKTHFREDYLEITETGELTLEQAG